MTAVGGPALHTTGTAKCVWHQTMVGLEVCGAAAAAPFSRRGTRPCRLTNPLPLLAPSSSRGLSLFFAVLSFLSGHLQLCKESRSDTLRWCI